MFLVCGEALYDLFATGDGEASNIKFDGRVGGSPFNVAIGMARLGTPTALFAGISTDMPGEKLAMALEREGVNRQYLIRSGRRTTLSVVGLDATGGPSYSFYGVGSADCSVDVDDLPVLGPDITGLHLGSYSIAVAPVADALATLVTREADRFISLDPNVRPTVEPDMRVWRDRIDALRRKASLIKVSAEDLGMLYPEADPLSIVETWATQGPELVVMTSGGEDVTAVRGNDTLRLKPPRIDVVDTVGAGDAFQASMLVSLCENGLDQRGALSSLGLPMLETILGRAALAASITCTRRGADMPASADLADR